LLNVYWGCGWFENNCTAVKNSFSAKQQTFWEQIATAMRDLDKHGIFARANEPNILGTGGAVDRRTDKTLGQRAINAIMSGNK
jgi:endoglucanase